MPDDGPVARPLRGAAGAIDHFQDAQQCLRMRTELYFDLWQLTEITEERDYSDHHDGTFDGRDIGHLARPPVGF